MVKHCNPFIDDKAEESMGDILQEDTEDSNDNEVLEEKRSTKKKKKNDLLQDSEDSGGDGACKKQRQIDVSSQLKLVTPEKQAAKLYFEDRDKEEDEDHPPTKIISSHNENKSKDKDGDYDDIEALMHNPVVDASDGTQSRQIHSLINKKTN